MKDLKCGLKDCTYNAGYCCQARSIEVDKFTDCLTYQKDPDKRKNLTEAGRDVKAKYDVDTKITCFARCMFNRDTKCVSNGITVMGQEDNQANCMTFIKD